MESTMPDLKRRNWLTQGAITLAVLLLILSFSPSGQRVLGQFKNWLPGYTISPGEPYYKKGLAELNSPYGFIRITAAADFTKAIKADPDYAEAYYARAHAFLDQGLMDACLRDLNKAIELRPNYFDARQLRGGVYLNQSQWDKALPDLDKAIKLMPPDLEKTLAEETYMSRALAFWGLNRLDEAIADFKQSLELKPDDSLAYFYLGDVYLKQDKLKDVITAFTKGLALQPAYDLRGTLPQLQKLVAEETDATTRDQAQTLIARIQP